MYKNLFFDADGTIYDFHASEVFALDLVWNEFNLPKETQNIYLECNHKCWDDFEKKKITIDQLKVKRFADFLRIINNNTINQDVISEKFLEALSEKGILYDESRGILEELKRRGFNIYIVTNGVKKVQEGRFSLHLKEGLFKQVFCSEALGVGKPQKEFFDKVFTQLKFNEDDIKRSIIIGDSLSSDIQGGINAGIPTVWINRNNAPSKPNIKPTYQINRLDELLSIFSAN